MELKKDINSLRPSDAYMLQCNIPPLLQIMACRLFGWRQGIIWSNVGILLIGHLETNFSEILIQIHKFSFNKMHLKMSSAKWHLFCLGLNVLTHKQLGTHGCVLSTVATDALVLNHLAMGMLHYEWISIVLDQFYTKILTFKGYIYMYIYIYIYVQNLS